MADLLLMERPGARLDFRTLTHTRIDSLERLRAAAQLAVQIEMTTIPAYLTTLYSIADRTSNAYQTVRSVVVEEMFHLNQAANILVGVGGRPRLTGSAVPVYPAYLPSANTKQTPYIGLFRGSPSVFSNVFMAIETPAPFTAPPEGKNYQTIGQFYKALWDGICLCVERFGERAVFRQDPKAAQRTDIYLGKFGGRPVEVVSKDTAWAGIQQIVEQGEGAVDPTRTIVPTQPFGSYNHYGMRPDGTYGPILGTPYELSHYYKFMVIANAPDFPATLPIISNPKRSDFPPESEVAKALDTFNLAYSVMLKSFEAVFSSGVGDSGLFFKTTLPIMCDGMPGLAAMLMNTPLSPDGDASVGPNAAPTYEYIETATLGGVISALDELGSGPTAGGIGSFLQSGFLPSGAGATAAVPDRTAKAREVAGTFRKLQRMAQSAGFDL